MKLRVLFAGAAAVVGLSVLVSCSQTRAASELRSLSGSEDTVFLCRDGNGVGRSLSNCPDLDVDDDDDPERRFTTVALVTQTLTDEVAVVDVTAGRVVDIDPSLPGYGFLRVGGRPVSLASTPGGQATFVATTDVGRNGLFALPTTCLQPPSEGRRELTSWPACRLDEAPGEVTIVVEPTLGSAADGVECKLYEPAPEGAKPETVCEKPTDLSTEQGPEGRRKLLVTFPDSGTVRVYDAQELLDRTPGTFQACRAERELKLKVDVPQGVSQVLPPDLASLAPDSENACSEVPAPTAPAPGQRRPQPAGIALGGERLYVADQAAPVIHVLDASSPCALAELPSLLPMSLREPHRVVVTRRLAVSPLTPAGKRYVYAIDAEDQPGASVMVFDVSPDSTDPTPLVRPGSPELPNERPDRLWLSSALANSSVRDITFAYRDIPYVDQSESGTGVAEFGVRCDPDPKATDPQATRARPNSDYTDGARAGLLRGLFGFVMLTSGSIAVIDVDDLDADCRRPLTGNPTDTPDFRGCVHDPEVSEFRDPNGNATVTDEVSCRVVEPHQVRSSRLLLNTATSGIRAPSLRSFPQLLLPTSAASTDSLERARLLAVPYAGPEGEPLPTDVFVASTRYSTSPTGADVVPTNPNDASTEQLQVLSSLVLPWLEPRAYTPDDTFTVTYEGSYAGDRLSGFLSVDADGDTGRLTDDALSFCGAGVYDVATMTDYATRELGAEPAQAAAFAESHADYVQLTTGFLDANDTWWRRDGGVTREQCVEVFGAEDAQPLLPSRELKIVAAHADKLEVTPRNPVTATGLTITMELVKSCFPTSQRYRLRAGRHWVLSRTSTGFRHDVVESGSERRCVRSCDPLKKWNKGRVFEISASAGACRRPEDPPGDPLVDRVGCAEDPNDPCVYDQRQGGVDPSFKCVFNGLTARFALYRGRTASVTDQAFTWQTTGGFSPLTMSLSALSTTVAPQSIQYVSEVEQLAVVDGASQGLSLFSLDTFNVVKPSPFY